MGELYRQFIERTDLDLHKWHHYVPIYEAHLGRFCGKPVRMLEIGVRNGGSGRLFLDWLGPLAHITGVDIDPKCSALAMPDRYHVEIGDQADRAFLARVVAEHGPFDIILDDGGHTTNQVLTSFDALFDTMADGACYLIEDTHTHFWSGDFQDRSDGRTIIDLVGERMHDLHCWTGQRDHVGRWHSPPDQRGDPLPAPPRARHTHSAHLYESLVVIEKGRRAEPFAEIRRAGSPRATEYRITCDPRLDEIDRLRREVAALRSSTSWRITAPLRAVMHALRGRRGEFG